ncbi:hypothetical protein HMPREF9004_0078 [Schaalia cardiffensis F0333]|uniref:Uncharacterized protein n=1 Tax=Schaalia cardiffensis F0333 TaxID=888050 RepID=N6WG13_9ACTO|nr:hypothetical protein HMPREF9004_0078 [Schaalia cardiffensis F0333]
MHWVSEKRLIEFLPRLGSSIAQKKRRPWAPHEPLRRAQTLETA